ncbi:MAG: tetratricopeptide repeat protein [Anaerolineales bacterium]|nr:MAG: tetratricopeptide repeat protein [Anaerolineales bacterium]
MSGNKKSGHPFRELPEGTVTFLFTDIEGSTELLQRLKDQYAKLLADQREILRAILEKWGGREVDTQGDAFFVAFPRASDAVNAAADAQRALVSHDWPEGVEVRVRMGLHTGEPWVGEEGYVGMDVHRAARIAHIGHGGQVLLSESTTSLVQDDLPKGVRLKDLGHHRLKDLRRSRQIHQLVISDLGGDFPPLKSLDAYRHNLPIQPTPLIGREVELRKAQDLLLQPEVRLLTLTGPGGIGKTRLGLQLGAALSDHFPEGVYYVPLTPITSFELVIPTIAQTVGVREHGNEPILESLIQRIKSQGVLFILDNFEHLMPAASDVAGLLERCPQIKVLVTSREVLHLRWEYEFLVQPLALPDPLIESPLDQLSHSTAVNLFVQRARAVERDFVLTGENAHVVGKICERLEGLPLAIELAAARIKILPPRAMLKRLTDTNGGSSLDLLKGGALDAPERHRTLFATIDWSYKLLSEKEQGLLRSLSVFSGGFSLQAAEKVYCVPDGEVTASHDSSFEYGVMEGIASLLDKSLIRQEDIGADPRYAMLEMIREHALMKMKESGQEREIRWRHANHFLAMAEDANDHLRGPEQTLWLEQLEIDLNNIRSALRWFLQRAQGENEHQGEAEKAGLRMVSALVRFWDTHGHLTEGHRWLSELLGISDTPSEERVDALIGIADFAIRLSGVLDVLEYYEQALTLARSLGYAIGIAQALEGLASVHQLHGGDEELVQSLQSESLQIWRQLKDQRGIASALGPLAHRAALHFEFDEATSLFKESLSLFQDMGDQREIGGALWNLGQIELRRGRYESGTELFNESLEIYQDLKDTHGISTQLRCLAEVERALGNLEKARALYEESLVDFRAIGDKGCASIALMGLGQVALNCADPESAMSYIEESLTLSREVGIPHKVAEDLIILGLVELNRGNQAFAEEHFKESMGIAQELDSRECIAANLEGIARLSVTQEDFERAAQLFSAAAILRESLGIPVPPIDQIDLEKWNSTIRAELGQASFERVQRKGSLISLEQAIRLAMESQI